MAMKEPTVSLFEVLGKRLLDFYFGRLRKRDNYRPDWLKGLEIDRFYPEIKVAVEFQGIQHLRPTKQLEQTREQFFQQLEKDTLKRRLCEEQGITLVTLGLLDLDQDRFKTNFQRIAEVGIRNAEEVGDQRLINYLKSIPWHREPDPEIFKRLEGMRRSKKWQVRPQRKTFWRKLFGR